MLGYYRIYLARVTNVLSCFDFHHALSFPLLYLLLCVQMAGIYTLPDAVRINRQMRVLIYVLLLLHALLQVILSRFSGAGGWNDSSVTESFGSILSARPRYQFAAGYTWILGLSCKHLHALLIKKRLFVSVKGSYYDTGREKKIGSDDDRKNSSGRLQQPKSISVVQLDQNYEVNRRDDRADDRTLVVNQASVRGSPVPKKSAAPCRQTGQIVQPGNQAESFHDPRVPLVSSVDVPHVVTGDPSCMAFNVSTTDVRPSSSQNSLVSRDGVLAGPAKKARAQIRDTEKNPGMCESFRKHSSNINRKKDVLLSFQKDDSILNDRKSFDAQILRLLGVSVDPDPSTKWAWSHGVLPKTAHHRMSA